MFDLADSASTSTKRRESPLPAASAGQTEPKDEHPLDSQESVEIFYRLLDAYTRELDRQQLNRQEQAVDEDFFDNKQWDEHDARTIEERGQKATVYNVIATTLNWVIGTEKRGRTDYHILPRRKEQAKPAEKKSQLLKYLADCNRTPFHRSRSFADAVKVGIGWLEDGVWEDDDGEPIYSRYESWRNMLYDSAATELDLSDARYIFRVKWVDLDIAKALFPGRAGLLERSSRDGERFVSSTGEFGDDAMDAAELDMERSGSPSRLPNRYVRERVRIIEGWFKHPEKAKRVKGGTFSGELFDASSPGHVDEVDSGQADLAENPVMRVHVALFTINGLLHLSPSPYRHNRYPFTPIWGNRRGKDGLPYGMIRGLKSIQESINKRASKALYLLSARRTTVEEGASDDMDALAEEAAQPDAFLVIKPGKQLKIEDGRALAAAELEFMSRDIAMVQQQGGVTDENLGRRTNATSGIAIERRQDQGSTTTTHYFDNLRLALQVQGEKQLSLIEQFVSDQKQFRITNMRGKPEYVTVNDGLPENDIVRSKADFVIAEGDWRATMRQAAAEQLLETMKQLPPEISIVMLDLVVESMDLPNREEIVRRLREATGQMDPDADENDPDTMARKQQMAKKAQRADQAELAQLKKLVAEGDLKTAQAYVATTQAVRNSIAAMGGARGAIDIAADVMAMPAVAPVADGIMREAGFVDRSEKEKASAQEQQQQQAAAQAQAQAEQQAQQAQQQPQRPQQPANPQQPQGNGAG